MFTHFDNLFLEHPWVSEGRRGPIKLDFKGSGCDHEALGVLGANKFAKQKFLHQIWPLFGYPESKLLVFLVFLYLYTLKYWDVVSANPLPPQMVKDHTFTFFYPSLSNQ